MKFAMGLAAVMALALCGAARAQAPATPVNLSLAYDGSLYIKVLDIHFDEQATPTGFTADGTAEPGGASTIAPARSRADAIGRRSPSATPHAS